MASIKDAIGRQIDLEKSIMEQASRKTPFLRNR
jgi:hypothetical protein